MQSRTVFQILETVGFSDKLFTMQFVRKYIHMAKSVKPKLTEEASAYISECYAELRSFDTSKTDRERVYLNLTGNFDTSVYFTKNYFKQFVFSLAALQIYCYAKSGIHRKTLTVPRNHKLR